MLIPIFSIHIFFSVCALMGYNYSGSENSPLYRIYISMVFFVSILIFIYEVFIEKIKISKGQKLIILIPFITTFVFLLNELINLNQYNSSKYFMYFILFNVPPLYMGILIARNNRFKELSKFLEVLMIIFTSTIMITAIRSILVLGRFESIGGETYQFASYLSAFSFGINLYFIFNGSIHERFRFTSYRIYKILCYILLIVQIMGVLISGGRGGMVLAIIYLIYIVLNSNNLKKISKVSNLVLLILLFVLLYYIILPQLLIIESFNISYNRLFTYISSDGFSWSGTNRSAVYSEALSHIIRKPLFGYGLFNWGAENYPHNILLEIMLNGGLFYLLFSILFTITLLYKLSRMVYQDLRFRLLIIIFAFPLVMLMFSGTYMLNTIFWFSISFIMSYNLKNSKLTSNEYFNLEENDI